MRQEVKGVTKEGDNPSTVFPSREKSRQLTDAANIGLDPDGWDWNLERLLAGHREKWKTCIHGAVFDWDLALEGCFQKWDFFRPLAAPETDPLEIVQVDRGEDGACIAAAKVKGAGVVAVGPRATETDP